MIETADNLIGRFDENISCIRSWDFGTWNFPVIIDNMMNLDLLFTVSKITGDPKYKEVAIKHADKTMANHFRPDYTCWHVVSYNNDGSVERKQTHQGKMMILLGRVVKHGLYMDILHVIVKQVIRNILILQRILQI